MEELFEYRRDLISALEAVLPRLFHLAAGVPATSWHISPGPGAYTPHYILSRLLVLESRLFNPYTHRIVEENAPRLLLFDADAWLAEHYDSTASLEPMLDQFAHLRTQHVAWLQGLPSGSWSRAARHPWWGLRTLQWWVERQLDESQSHLEALAAFQPL